MLGLKQETRASGTAASHLEPIQSSLSLPSSCDHSRKVSSPGLFSHMMLIVTSWIRIFNFLVAKNKTYEGLNGSNLMWGMCATCKANTLFLRGLRVYLGVTSWGELLEGGEGQESLGLPWTLNIIWLDLFPQVDCSSGLFKHLRWGLFVYPVSSYTGVLGISEWPNE